ncbi:macro domain-containing protein [Aliarcobacter butzleri]|uniref:macro domain-containing protein n=1 Tax=Aliarcobacter butzleri TaxID=28197 RepID=UPI003AF52A1E
MIKYVEGDFFDYDTDIRINTVNCVGVMGAGVALAFKNKYPDMYKEYVSVCKNNQIEPGKPHIWSSGNLFSKALTIINFPTKIHWRNNSEYEYIEKGLQWLQEYLKDKQNISISLPALGCGHGGLDWSLVKKLIEKYLSNSLAEILVFEPSASKTVKENILLNPSIKLELKKDGIVTIDSNNARYPLMLKRISEKTLFFKGNFSNLSQKSIAIISSTKPNEKEEQIIESFLNHIDNENINLIFGNTTFEKKIIKKFDSNPMTIVLPSGLKIFCEKDINKEICNNSNNLLISLGDVFIDFDKKEYMSSVFARIFLADIVLFTTPKLEWISKYKRKLTYFTGSMFYINYKELSNVIKEDLKNLSISEINRDSKTLLPKFNSIVLM